MENKSFRNFAFPKSGQKLKVFGNVRYGKTRDLFVATARTKRYSDNYYVFLDEIQLLDNFERLLDGLHMLKNVDLYVTGSNAYLLSSELATILTGRTENAQNTRQGIYR